MAKNDDLASSLKGNKIINAIGSMANMDRYKGLAGKKKSKPSTARGNQIYAPSGKSATDGKGSVSNGIWSPNAPAKKKTPTAKKSYNGHKGK
jgi:hypothetical protein